MKSTGIVRRIDCLGRIVIPKDIRKKMDLKEGDPLELFLKDNCVVFKKFEDERVKDTIHNLKQIVKHDLDDDTAKSIMQHIEDIEKILKDVNL